MSAAFYYLFAYILAATFFIEANINGSKYRTAMALIVMVIIFIRVTYLYLSEENNE